MPSGSGLVTNVAVLTALVKMVADQGARPLVGDLPIVGWDPKKVFDSTGVREIEAAGGELLDWSGNHLEIELPNAKILKRVPIARPAIEVDAIINVPVLKHHYLTHLSGGMKNLFGLIEPDFRPRVHVLGLDEPLVDLYEFLKPKIVMNVMDATWIAQSVRPAGPYYGPTEAKSAFAANMVMASKDTVALDAVASRVIRIDPMDVEMVRIARERGLSSEPRTVGNARGASLKIKKSLVGKIMPYVEDAWTSEHLNAIAHPFAKRLYGKDVVSLKDVRREMDEADPSRIVLAGECRQCGLCAGACPEKNIILKESGPSIGKKCIKCFICVEVCPNGVLAIGRK
jgi:uncharacterized protein (DUF362 family)/NAD-dependent dihydropyrimidine dehydrogenase PreA subunit